MTRIVVLASGSGSNLQALIDASRHEEWGGEVAAVGSDVAEAHALVRAERAGIPTFVVPMLPDRAAWDSALATAVAEHHPDIVVLAGFMRLVGTHFLTAFGGRTYNTHPALSPSFPGAHAVRDALAYGVKVTGCTLFEVDAGVDTGRVIAQAAVPVVEGDTEETLHERIKEVERAMLVTEVGKLIRAR